MLKYNYHKNIIIQMYIYVKNIIMLKYIYVRKYNYVKI